MPSGKKSKQARRLAAQAPPPVQSKGSKGTRRRRQASPRALAIGAAVVVLAGAGIGIGVGFSGGGGSSIPKNIPTFGSVADGLPGASDVAAMFKGIPQKGFFLGSPFAPVQMVIYIDLQCPICQNFETTISPTLVSKYVRPGKVRIEVRPWAFIGPDSVRGQAATIAAARQNKAFDFAQVLYDNQGTENTGWLTDNMIVQIAESVPGLNVPQLLRERSSGAVKSAASQVDASATIDKVSGTPTIFVGRNGTKPALVGTSAYAPTLSQVETAINDSLAA